MPRFGHLAVAAVLLTGQPALAADYHAPRNAYGAPDLDGLWSNSSLTQLERPDSFKTLVIPEAEAQAYDKTHIGQPPEAPEDPVGQLTSEFWETNVGLARIRGLPRTSWIVSPADGQLPYTDAVKARNKTRGAGYKTNFDNPETRHLSERCLPDQAGPPFVNGGYDDNYQFVQTRDQLAMVGEYNHEVRIIRFGGQHPPKSVRLWLGDSIARWEGDTLVVETTNFTPAEVDAVNPTGDDDMRVVERIRRISPAELSYDFTIESPSVLIQTVRGEMVMHATKGPIYEFACHEGNYGLANILSGGRQQDLAKKP